jgi:hypothetical protein
VTPLAERLQVARVVRAALRLGHNVIRDHATAGITQACSHAGTMLTRQSSVCAFPAVGMHRFPSLAELVPCVAIPSLVAAASPQVGHLPPLLGVGRAGALTACRTARFRTEADRGAWHLLYLHPRRHAQDGDYCFSSVHLGHPADVSVPKMCSSTPTHRGALFTLAISTTTNAARNRMRLRLNMVCAPSSPRARRQALYCSGSTRPGYPRP